jgi:hypothetical protein
MSALRAHFARSPHGAVERYPQPRMALQVLLNPAAALLGEVQPCILEQLYGLSCREYAGDVMREVDVVQPPHPAALPLA